MKGEPNALKKVLYLILAVLGAFLTWYFNLQFMLESYGQLSFAALLQFDWIGFVSSGLANPAASSLTVDLLIPLSLNRFALCHPSCISRYREPCNNQRNKS